MNCSLIALLLAYHALLTLQQEQKRLRQNQQMNNIWDKRVPRTGQKHGGPFRGAEPQQDNSDYIKTIRTNERQSQNGGRQKLKTTLGDNYNDGISAASLNRKSPTNNIPPSKLYSSENRQLVKLKAKPYSSIHSRVKNPKGRSSRKFHSKPRRHQRDGFPASKGYLEHMLDSPNDTVTQSSPLTLSQSPSLAPDSTLTGSSSSKTPETNSKFYSVHGITQNILDTGATTENTPLNDQPVSGVKSDPKRSRQKRRSEPRRRKQHRKSKRHRKRYSGDEFDQRYSPKDNVGLEEEKDGDGSVNGEHSKTLSETSDHQKAEKNNLKKDLVDDSDEDSISDKDSKPNVDQRKPVKSTTKPGKVKANRERFIRDPDDEEDNVVEDGDDSSVSGTSIVTPPPAFGLFATVQELVLTVKALYQQQEQDRQRLQLLERHFQSQNNDLQLQQTKVTHLTESLANVESTLSNLEITTKKVGREVAQVRTKNHRLGRSIGDNRRYRRRLAEKVDDIAEQLTQDIELFRTKHNSELDKIYSDFQEIHDTMNNEQLTQDIELFRTKHNSEFNKIYSDFQDIHDIMNNVKDDIINIKTSVEEFDRKESVNNERISILEDEQEETLQRVADLERNVSHVRTELKEIRNEHRDLIRNLEDVEDALVISSDPEYHDEFEERQRDSSAQTVGFEDTSESKDNGRVRKSRHLSRILASLAIGSRKKTPSGEASYETEDGQNILNYDHRDDFDSSDSERDSGEYEDYYTNEEELKDNKHEQIEVVYNSKDSFGTVYEVLTTYDTPAVQTETPSSTTLDSTHFFSEATVSDIIHNVHKSNSNPPNLNTRPGLTTEQQTTPSTSTRHRESSGELSHVKSQGTKSMLKSANGVKNDTIIEYEETTGIKISSTSISATETPTNSNTAVPMTTDTPSVISEASHLSPFEPSTTDLPQTQSTTSDFTSSSSSFHSSSSSGSSQPQSTTSSLRHTDLLPDQPSTAFWNDTQSPITTLNNVTNDTVQQEETTGYLEITDKTNITFINQYNVSSPHLVPNDTSQKVDTTQISTSPHSLPSLTSTATTEIPLVNINKTSSFTTEMANKSLVNETIPENTPNTFNEDNENWIEDLRNNTFALHSRNSSTLLNTTYNDTDSPLNSNTSDNHYFSQTTTQTPPINTEFHAHILHLEQRIKTLENSMSKMSVNNETDAMEDLRSFVVNETAGLEERLQQQEAEIRNQTGLFTEEFGKRDRDIQDVQNVAAKTSVMLAQLANQVSAINMGEFITKLQESLGNFTQNVLTLDQWKVTSERIVNSTIDNELKISRVNEKMMENAHSVLKIHDRVSLVHTQSQRWYRSLQGHVIRLNNTVQDLREKVQLMDRHDQRKTVNYNDPSNLATQAKLDSLNVQLLYNANRLSTLESTMLNQSLIQCRRSHTELQQASKLLRLDERQDQARKELTLLQDKVKRVDLNVFRVHSAIKENEKSVESLENDVTRLLPMESSIQELYREMENLVHNVPDDCHDYFLRGYTESGIYVIHPKYANKTVRVHCLMEGHPLPYGDCCKSTSIVKGNNFATERNGKDKEGNKDESKLNLVYGLDGQSNDGYAEDDEGRDNNGDSYTGGWTILQRRLNGKVNFTRSWLDYSLGFGDTNDEFWAGNDLIHLLTNQKDYELRIVMKDMFFGVWEARYDQFKVSDKGDNYRIHISGYHGNASDGMSYSNQMPFSAVDKDNDASSSHCALYNGGGWWYSHCSVSNLNGPFDIGMVWFNRAWQDWIQMQSTILMIRPKQL